MAKLDLAFQLTANASGMAAGVEKADKELSRLGASAKTTSYELRKSTEGFDTKGLADGVAKADRELSKVGASAKATSAEFRQAAKITQELRTPTEKYADTIAKLNAMMQKGLLSQEVYGRAVSKAEAEMKAATSSMDGLAKSASVAERIVNRTSSALRGVGDAVGSVASAGSAVISFGEDFARASAEIVAATTAWRLFSSATAMFRTPEGIWGIASGLSRALVVIKLAEVGLTQLGIEANGAADFATKATLAFAAFKVGKLAGLDKQLVPFIASLTTALPAALARAGVPIAATTAALSSLGVVGNFIGGQLTKVALMSIPGFGQLAATVYVVGKAFLNARERAYEMAAGITAGTTSLESLNAELGTVQAQQVDNLAFAMEEATAAGERSQSAFAGLADVFVTPFIGAFAAVQSGLAGFTDGISGVIEGVTSIIAPIAQVIAPVFTLIGTLVEGVLKFIGVLGESLGIVLKVAGAVVQTFLSPFIVGLTNVVEAIRSGMNAAFGYIGEQIDWASQKIQDFYAFMSKVPIIGGAFASGGSPAAGPAADAAAADSSAATKDTLDADLQIYNARRANEQAIADADKKAAQERFDMEQKMFEAQRANEQAIADARRKEEKEKFDFEMQMYATQRENEQKLIEANQKRAEEAAKIDEKMAAKQEDINKVVAERQSALGGKSNEALKANDLRSGEGMAQFLALASGREDPAIAEYRKQTQKLDEIRGELRALQQEKVDILGAAA